jgi:hypothetical protein
MDELLSSFNDIESRSDIDEIIKKSSSPDGEYIWFEMKGTSEKVKIDRDLKKLFAKEISAFANTYGGILCIHKGKDTEVKSFEPLEINDLHNCVETWLRDSLEPRSQGMILKERSGLFLILIPESRTKPHRSALDKLYYYRHNTQSQTMSELMISAMYRSQDYLATSASIVLNKGNPQQLSLDLIINNKSMIPGTKPRVMIQLFSCHQGRLNYFTYGKKVAGWPTESFTVPYSFYCNSSLYSNCEIHTTDEFKDFILYPKDELRLTCYLSPRDGFDINHIRFCLIRLDYFFLETTRQIKYFLIDIESNSLGGNIRTKVIATGLENEEIEILSKYVDLISSNQDNNVK